MASRVPVKKRKHYHHGSLRDAALDNAKAEIAARGHEAFTLDRLAKKLGVSTPALYRHYRNKEALLAAVILEGFERFVARMDDAATTPTDPVDVLRGAGRAYVRFAVENPGWFRLQFSSAGLAAGGRHEVQPRYFEAMMGAVASLLGTNEPERVQLAYLAFWAEAHGLSGLTVEGVLGVSPVEERLALADAVLEAFLARMAADVSTPPR